MHFRGPEDTSQSSFGTRESCLRGTPRSMLHMLIGDGAERRRPCTCCTHCTVHRWVRIHDRSAITIIPVFHSDLLCTTYITKVPFEYQALTRLLCGITLEHIWRMLTIVTACCIFYHQPVMDTARETIQISIGKSEQMLTVRSCDRNAKLNNVRWIINNWNSGGGKS